MQRDGAHVLRLLQHHPPAHHRRAQADADEAQRGLAEDHVGDRDRQMDDQVAQEAGQQVAGDDRHRPGAANGGRGHVIFGAQLQQLAAHHPRQAGPADHAQDDGDHEVDAQRRPLDRHRRRQRHPQRNGGQRLQELDDALHQHVHRTAEEAGDAAEQAAERKADRHPDQADRERHPRPVQHPRQHVAPQAVGAEREQHPRFVHPQEVDAERNQAEQPVLVTGYEEPHGKGLLPVDGKHLGARHRVAGHLQAVHERRAQAALVRQPHARGRRVQVLRVAPVAARHREEVGEDGQQVDDAQRHAADQRQPVAHEAAAHERPTRSDVVPLVVEAPRAGGSRLPGAHAAAFRRAPAPRSGCADRPRPAADRRSTCPPGSRRRAA